MKKRAQEHLVGLISDTHGLLRPEAVEALRGVELILHAGDIGSPLVLEDLRALAPVIAVRGNNDTEPWAESIDISRVVNVGAVSIYMLHDVKELRIDPAAEGHRVVVSGHSHKPSVVERGAVLYVNPGSAGRRRFKLPVSIALLKISGPRTEAKIVELKI